MRVKYVEEKWLKERSKWKKIKDEKEEEGQMVLTCG